VKFTDRGSVTVRAQTLADDHDGVEVRVEVEDTGIGISEGAQARLFQPFVQAEESTTRRFGGTGLGLAITKHLVELMGGQIGVKSQVGIGTTFWFTARLAKSKAAADPSWKADRRHAREPKLAHAPSHATRILVAEDSDINRKVIGGMLDHLGYRYDMVGNGRLAVDAALETSYGAILMDCQIPELDGLAATRELRRREKSHRRTPVVAMTANVMEGDRQACIAAGMDEYLAKPLRIAEIASVLHRRVAETTAGHNSEDAHKKRLATPTGSETPRAPVRKARRGAQPVGAASAARTELFDLFREEATPILRVLRDALNRGDTRALGEQAHRLKGDAGIVGAHQVESIAAELENVARQGTMSGAEPLVRQLEASLQHILAEAS
jgi:CheY-like chemotaxis protein